MTGERDSGDGRQPKNPQPEPDDTVDQILADEKMRAVLAAVYEKIGITEPFDQIPRSVHAAYIMMLFPDGTMPADDGPPPVVTSTAPAAADAVPPEPGIRSRLFGRWMRR